MGNILSNILSGGTAALVEKVGEAIDRNITNKEERDAAKLELEKELNRHLESVESEATKKIDIYLKDVQSSRDANVKIQQSDKSSWWAKNTAYFLDVFLGLIWGFVTILILLKALKLVEVQAEWTVILSLHTAVTTMFMIPVQFHRGSTITSRNKDKTIENLTKQNDV